MPALIVAASPNKAAASVLRIGPMFVTRANTWFASFRSFQSLLVPTRGDPIGLLQGISSDCCVIRSAISR